MIGKVPGGSGAGPLGKFKQLLNPQNLLEKLQQTLQEKLGGLLGGLGGPAAAAGQRGGTLDPIRKLDPASLMAGLLGGAQSRGL